LNKRRRPIESGGGGFFRFGCEAVPGGRCGRRQNEREANRKRNPVESD
jgi:hypothetical protein